MKWFILLLALIPSSTTAATIEYSFRCGPDVFYCGRHVDREKDCDHGGGRKTHTKLNVAGPECAGLIDVVENSGDDDIFVYECPEVGGVAHKISMWVSYDFDRNVAYKNTPDDLRRLMSKPEHGRKLYQSQECEWTRPPNAGTSGGDPHFSTYDGTQYSYHGECDLVMARSSSFRGGMGLDLHVRTKGMGSWSLISNAVLRIGEDLFEFTNDGSHFVNGKPLSLPFQMAGSFNVTKERSVIEKDVGGKIQKIDMTFAKVDLGNEKYIKFTRIGKGIMYVKVNVYMPDTEGMLGVHGVEGLVGRDGRKLEDGDAMGIEWQVNDTEPMMFREIRAPQFPEPCKPPANRRRLGRSVIDYKTAAKACADAGDGGREFCIDDVMLSGDVESALPYSFGEAF